MTSDLHKQWAMQWKAAAPRLQEIRDAELRSLDARTSNRPREEDPYQNELVIFQRWMMRQAIIDAYCDGQC